MQTSVKNKLRGEGTWTRFAIGLLVLALHAALIYGLWRARPGVLDVPTPVFVRLLEAPPLIPAKQSSHPAPALPVKRDLPQPPAPAWVATEALGVIPLEAVAPPVINTPGLVAAEPTAPRQSAEQISLASELSLSCPVRTAPVYPARARRMGETGSVLLRVELDQAGRLLSSEVARSSGFPRLDEAALDAVKNWRCNPALRDGQAVRVVSMESFDFKLKPEGD